MKKSISDFVKFNCGKIMPNRFMLAPMTNQQSYENGHLSDEEYNWLIMRAKGGFGLVMTCASHVNKVGKGFPGQLGIFSDDLIEDHKRLSKGIQSHGSLAVIQLHHAGMRSPNELIGKVSLCPSENKKHNARAMSLQEVIDLKNDFINAAYRSMLAGYDGVEVHGAHGYILTQFISSEINKRNDIYGGSFENRIRLILEIIDGIRNRCGSKFLLGIRLSPERFGMKLNEIIEFCKILVNNHELDFLDISLWDVDKYPEGQNETEKRLLDYLLDINFKHVKLTVSGKIRNAKKVLELINQKIDFVNVGRAGILHHDFPLQIKNNSNFYAVENPVSAHYLREEGLSDKFIEYMRRWPNFVK